ncbi:Integral membrane protein (intg_mem_TP0381) [Streptococcus constellatus]|uniref:Integral membrane protein (Intg_mem_TP0381) n=1 Tax=Streptococcus constellatus TaxID=76860 RepID=A0A564SW27_STRCV|nr:TIGR02206 family membrane protein [Streptococcus constellatus]VUW98610.1 Integral membrane protein (intg_mem_TP0381) [Streptococcus constellatus]VUX06827.1 Integral membrane protein (intg_mem_TP0381) [Streptococcus gordonii]
MNLQELFTSHKTEPPQLSPFWYGMMFLGMIYVMYSAVKYHQDKRYQIFLKCVQGLQILVLYSWYVTTLSPISEALPFYHCRLAMFAVLLLPDSSVYKQYFALLGVFGPICALVYPIFDPFAFPHITFVSYLIGHYALLGNSLTYLMNHYDSEQLSLRRIVEISFGMNLLLLFVNLVSGGNYGFLKVPPLVGDHGMMGNYIFVSLTLILAIWSISLVFKQIRQEQEETVRQEN